MAYYLLVHLKESGKLDSNYEIVTSVVSSALPFKIAEDFGIKTKHVLTGFKYIGEEVDRMNKAKDAKLLMGFEESYGYLFKPFARDKDAMQGALMFAEVASYYASKNMTVLMDSKKFGVNTVLHMKLLKQSKCQELVVKRRWPN